MYLFLQQINIDNLISHIVLSEIYNWVIWMYLSIVSETKFHVDAQNDAHLKDA